MDSQILLVTSEDAERDSIFSGVAYTDREIIVEQRGFEEYALRCNPTGFAEAIVDGRFYAFLNLGSYAHAFTDPMGQDALYYFSRDNFWAVSNSFYELLVFLSPRFSLIPFLPATQSFLIGRSSGIGSQLISNRTMVEGIHVLPVGSALKLHKSGKLELTDSSCASYRRYLDEPYETLIIKALTESAERARALAEKGAEFFADLSGGQDSRGVYGLLAKTFPGFDKVKIISNPRKEDDFAVAQSLSKFYGHSLASSSGLKGHVGGEASFERWKQGNLGVYLPFYPSRTEKPEYRGFKANGGTMLAKEYADFSVQDYIVGFEKDFKSKESFQAVKNEFLQSFVDMSIDPSDPKAIDLFYFNFRSRFHYGRNWYVSLTQPVWSPFINPKLMAASLQLPTEQLRAGRIPADLLLATDPLLALHPFDEGYKSFSASVIGESAFWGGKAKVDWKALISSSNRYTVYGLELKTRNKEASKNIKSGDSFSSAAMKAFDSALVDSKLVQETFTQKQIVSARNSLLSSKKLSGKGRGVAHMLSVATVDTLCSG